MESVECLWLSLEYYPDEFIVNEFLHVKRLQILEQRRLEYNDIWMCIRYVRVQRTPSWTRLISKTLPTFPHVIDDSINGLQQIFFHLT